MIDTASPLYSVPRQLVLPLISSTDSYKMEFIAGTSNLLARHWLLREGIKEEWPERRLILWGHSGCGKSHLLHVWGRAHNALILPGTALREGMQEAFLSLVSAHGGGAIGIDDADLIESEALLLHLMNFIQEQKGHLVLVGRSSPWGWRYQLADLQSRIRASLSVQMMPPDDDLLRILMLKLMACHQLVVSTAVVDWLLQRLPRTAPAVYEAVERIDRFSFQHGLALTREVAGQVLQQMGCLNMEK
ncbi:P-loop NTPase family protein [Entomobacter blattae]|uniref:DnaA regulatory inactivator Hda n=1 Tax=Entomobacter blattae TaxID=2762277 RepID=A0A7H1NS00_9PROT|nr:chromosomal replication initiator DnaA [Entomobacter blattae]QNT78560.1 DnaA regulatory inactivator Hda [Entomobacter blattae]